MFYERFKKGSSFINKRYQFRFITQFCASVLAGVVAAMIIFLYYTYSEIGTTYYQAFLTLHGLRQNILPAMVFAGGIVIIFTTLVIWGVTLISSNKIAGPIYRIERSLESIGNGDLSLKIRFRKHDAIEKIADDLNITTENYCSKIAAVSGNIKGIKDEAERLRANPDGPPVLLMEKIRLAKKMISEFKTE